MPRYWPSAHTGARALYGLYARIVEGRDLPLFRRAGKGIVVTYQGDDARQAQGFNARSDAQWTGTYYNAPDDARKRRLIEQFDRHAYAIFSLNPDLLDVLPARAEFLPYAATDPRTLIPTPPPRHEPPVVAHLPSDRLLKGTSAVVAAAAAIGADLRLVEGVKHADAIAALAAADVVVDQLVIGWYGAVAVEAMSLGRPVIAHLHEPDLARIPTEMRAELPVVDATAATLEDVLRATLNGDVVSLGRRGRAFVERWHDPRTIAGRLLEVYERSVA
jgi:glycosyltransferase involved in cell wall biosynthesis